MLDKVVSALLFAELFHLSTDLITGEVIVVYLIKMFKQFKDMKMYCYPFMTTSRDAPSD